MIDRVLELEPGKKVVAIKNVSINEGFFAGHFPEKPVFPGALIIEAMAQSSIMLFYSQGPSPKENPKYYLTCAKVRFLHPVFPADQLKITIEPIKLISSSGIVKATACVGDKEIASGELSFAVR